MKNYTIITPMNQASFIKRSPESLMPNRKQTLENMSSVSLLCEYAQRPWNDLKSTIRVPKMLDTKLNNS